MIRLSDDMRAWRAAYGLSQQAAADMAGVSLKAWRNWETERFRPREDNYYAVRYVISGPPYWWAGAARR